MGRAGAQEAGARLEPKNDADNDGVDDDPYIETTPENMMSYLQSYENMVNDIESLH